MATIDIATPAGKPGGLAGVINGQMIPFVAARLGISLARMQGKPIRFGNIILAVRYADIMETLARDLDFIIAPVNAPRFDEIGYRFILGMDRSDELIRERQVLYTALQQADMAAVQRAAQAEMAARIAAAARGSIDIVEGFARPVASATARALFGIQPANPARFMDAARAIFGHCFLNANNDAAIRDRAVAAAHQLDEWFATEIASRRASGVLGTDMMGALLRNGASDDLTRRSLGGMLVGSIDTTATVIAKVMTVLMQDKAARAAALRDTHDPRHLYGWCQEALRRWAQAPILVREAARETVLGGQAVPAGAKIILWIQAAMHDPDAFPDPLKLRRDRPLASYLHLGYGLHPCGGRSINAWQIPMLVGALLKLGPQKLDAMRWAGPFPAHLVMTFAGDRA
jgi:cytochrome P450